MKRGILMFALFFSSSAAWAQNQSFTISGGYVFTNLEETSSEANGYRINANFETNPSKGPVYHGLTIAYLHSTSTVTTASKITEYSMNTLPIYYAPKFTLGNGAAKAFVKGALGMHISGYKREGGAGDLNTTDVGFYGGASAGLMINVNEKVFLNAEYEWAYLSNSWYRDGYVNSAMAGIGFRF